MGLGEGGQGKIPDTFAAILGPIAMHDEFSDSPEEAQPKKHLPCGDPKINHGHWTAFPK